MNTNSNIITAHIFCLNFFMASSIARKGV